MSLSTSPAQPSASAMSRAEFIVIIAALMSVTALAIDAMLPALPEIASAFGLVADNDRQLIISAYMLGFGGAQLAYGPLTDRFGRRGPLLAGLAIYIAAAAAATLAQNFEQVLALRFVQGIGAAGTRVAAQSAIRDRFSGREMAEVMSLVMTAFMIIPIVAPGAGQLVLLFTPWWGVFLAMALAAATFGAWAFIRLPETLPVESRRPLSLGSVLQGFVIVFTNRAALCYSLASTFFFGALFGFINSAQQVYVDLYGLGPYFVLAFAGTALLVAFSSFLNSRFVRRFGLRKLAHGSLCAFVALSSVWLATGLLGGLTFWPFYGLLSCILFLFGWTFPNMTALSLEPLGAVAGTAASVFGFVQTVGGALIGAAIGQLFNGTTTPIAAGFVALGLVTIGMVVIGERGRLFGRD